MGRDWVDDPSWDHPNQQAMPYTTAYAIRARPVSVRGEARPSITGLGPGSTSTSMASTTPSRQRRARKPARLRDGPRGTASDPREANPPPASTGRPHHSLRDGKHQHPPPAGARDQAKAEGPEPEAQARPTGPAGPAGPAREASRTAGRRRHRRMRTTTMHTDMDKSATEPNSAADGSRAANRPAAAAPGRTHPARPAATTGPASSALPAAATGPAPATQPRTTAHHVVAAGLSPDRSAARPRTPSLQRHPALPSPAA